MKYLIMLVGCDDTTYYETDLTEEELKFLVKIAKEINKNSRYCCQPKICIYSGYTKNENGYYAIGCYDYGKDKFVETAVDLVGDSDE